MPILTGFQLNEMYRIVNCQGCQYLSSVSSNGYCKYYLDTGIRRPNEFGVENCAVKILDVKQSKVDEIVKKTLDRVAKQGKSNTAKWDVVTAKKLFDQGMSFAKISEYIGVPRRYVVQYAHKHGWRQD